MMNIDDVRVIFPEPIKAHTLQYNTSKKSKPKSIIPKAERLAVVEYYKKVKNILKVAKKFKRSTITIQEIISEPI